MNIDLGSFAFGSSLTSGSGTPSWGTALGQSRPDYKFTYPGAEAILIGMVYCSVPLDAVSLPLGKGGRIYLASEFQGCQLASLFRKVFINEVSINYPFIVVLVKEESDSHTGRKSIKYSDKNTYQLDGEQYSNQEFIRQARKYLSLGEDACWFIYNFEIHNQDELHMSAVIVDKDNSITYQNSSERRSLWIRLIPETIGSERIKELSDFDNHENHQIIFYGAPGTGKSHKIKEKEDVKTAEEKNMVIRTTFHPDSDYSTFVGAYKPSMKSSERIYSPEELTLKLKEIKTTGTTYPCHKFAAKYWESIKDLSPDSIKHILNACGFTDNYSVEVGKGIAIGQEFLNKPEDGVIVYTFCPQAFTNAYVKAWNTNENVYLIIEEINRGNCAQIFGDLFQLLDRKDGVSEYPVEADTDLRNYLCKALVDTKRTDIPDDVKSGKKLMLPSNLYIWATMNTSDQSLFPIDSAFKRRWDWVYIPIDTRMENWYIQVGDSRYSWTDFLNKVNNELLTDETAEDKHLGFYFCKAEDGIISQEKFVAKVLFYLWNDVFKVYGVPSVIGSGKDWSYAKFYNYDGSVNGERVKALLQRMGIDAVLGDQVVEDDEEMSDEPNTQRKETLISIQIPGLPLIKSSDSTQFNSFIEALKTIGIDRIKPYIDQLKYKRLDCPVLSTTRYQTIDNNDKGYSYQEVGGLFIIKGCKQYTYIRILEELNSYLDLGMTLETK